MSEWVELTAAGPPFLDEITAALRDAGITARLRDPEKEKALPTGVRTRYGARAAQAKVIEVERHQHAEASKILDEIFSEAEAEAHRQAVDQPATEAEIQEEREWRREVEKKRERSARRLKAALRLILLSIPAFAIGAAVWHKIHDRDNSPHQLVLPPGWTDVLTTRDQVPPFLAGLKKDQLPLIAADLRHLPDEYAYCYGERVTGRADLTDRDEAFVHGQMQKHCPEIGSDGWDKRPSDCFQLIESNRAEAFVRVVGINTIGDIKTRALGYLLPTPPTFIYCELPRLDCAECEAQIEQMIRSARR
jgi:hypothetical protein